MKCLRWIFASMVLLSSHSLFAQCAGLFPNFGLGNDTTICQGVGLLLNAGPGYTSYQWDNGSVNQTRQVSQAGTYSVTVGQIGTNLIVNGDFELGNSGFSTDYIVGTGGTYGQLSNEGTYAITTSPNLVHTNFNVCQDHTPNGTQMMVVNGSGTPNTDVWCQSVTVDPNTDYSFSVWAASAITNANVAQLQFSINGGILGSVFSPPTTGCSWNQFFQVWNSGANTSAQICIVNQNTANSGNDFMLDDISFGPICYATDEIVVSAIPSPVITASPSVTICANESTTLTASSTQTNLTYTWNPGATVANEITVNPATSQVYTVLGVTPEGCQSNLVSVPVIVKPIPVITLTPSASTLCSGETFQATAVSSVNGTTFVWQPVSGTAGILFDTPTQTTTYTVTGTSPNGCVVSESHEVVVTPPLEVTISGTTSFCDGAQTTLSASSNAAGTVFTWFPANVTGTTHTTSSTGEIILRGQAGTCPVAYDTVVLTAIPNPIVDVIDQLVLCPGESTSITASSDQANSLFVWSPTNETGQTITVQPQVSMYYYVQAMNGSCISNVDSVWIDLSGLCSLDVPNVFTPNNDGTNDYFSMLSSQGIQTMNCIIVNRWGNVINEFDIPNFQWNGEDKEGNKMPEGVYFYSIVATTAGGLTFEKQGLIHLLR